MSPTPAPAAVTVVAVPRGFAGGFTTPSGNVSCEIDASYVRCDAAQRPWREQPRKNCAASAWRTRLVLYEESAAELRGECGYPPPEGGPPLPYGTRLDVGRMRCFSERTGLTCWVAGTRFGMFVSRSAYKTSAQPPAAAVSATPSPKPSGTVLEVPRGFRGGFRTRGYKIVCDIEDVRVHCLMLGARWTPPPPDEPCVEGDRSKEVILEKGRPGRSFEGCRTDSLAGGEELAPGRGIRIGDVHCEAKGAALECRNDATRHGFVVSEASFRGY